MESPNEPYKSHYEYIKNNSPQLHNPIPPPPRNDNPTTHMNQATITPPHPPLPPKDDKKENLRNWRPISLPCSDYKILTKTLSNRQEPTLQHAASIE